MAKFYILSLLGLISFSVQAQYCMSGGPTTPNDSNVQGVDLTGDAGSISFVGCPGVLGVQDLTNLSTTLSGGSTYALDVQFGTCGGNYSAVGEVWIDFNNNQVFESSESIGTWTGSPPVALSTFNFTVPSGITNGTTRMRVAEAESTTLPMDPCASFSWGSIMDFSINLTGGVDCSGFVGNNFMDPINVNSFPYTNTHDNSFCYTNDNNAYVSPDVFYLVIPNPESEELSVSLCGSTFDTFLSVFDTDGNTITFNDDGSCGGQSEVSFSTVNLDSAFVVVEGWGAEMGEYTINISEATTGVKELKPEHITLYPNPANDFFSIDGITSTELFIHDISGKLIKTIPNYTGNQISTSDLTTGIYFVSFTENKKKITQKLSIKH